MMMMFVVTPSLESIEHKLNSKSINVNADAGGRPDGNFPSKFILYDIPEYNDNV
jgi:hypothetical protein